MLSSRGLRDRQFTRPDESSGCDVSECDVSECDVSECDVSECDVYECDLETLTLRRFRLTNKKNTGTDMQI